MNDCEASEIGCMHAGAHNGTIMSQVEPGVRLPLEQQLRACSAATSNPVPVQLLRKYIAYAKTFVAPVLSAEAKEVRIPHYLCSRDHMNTVAPMHAPHLLKLAGASAVCAPAPAPSAKYHVFTIDYSLQGEWTLYVFAPGTLRYLLAGPAGILPQGKVRGRYACDRPPSQLAPSGDPHPPVRGARQG